jgi:hypothetical protein
VQVSGPCDDEESKTASCEAVTPAVEWSKGTNKIVAKIQLREARSEQNFEMS